MIDKIFIKREERILRVQIANKYFLYKIIGKNKRIKYPDLLPIDIFIADLSKYLKYLGGGEIDVGEEIDKEWEEIKGGDRI